MKTNFSFILSLLFLTNCTSFNKNLVKGASLGTGVGFAIASKRNTSQETKIKETLLGTFVGVAIAYFLTKKKKKKSAPPLPYKKVDDVDKAPFLTNPEVRSYWEPDQILGNKYIEGHKIWILESRPEWTKK